MHQIPRESAEHFLPLIEPSHHILMSLGAVTRVHVLDENKPQRSQVKQTESDMCGDGTGYRLTIVIVYSCLREFIVLSRITTIPPPSTVSTVLAKRLGVRASKSCVTQKTNALKSIFATSTCLQQWFQTFFWIVTQ